MRRLGVRTTAAGVALALVALAGCSASDADEVGGGPTTASRSTTTRPAARDTPTTTQAPTTTGAPPTTEVPTTAAARGPAVADKAPRPRPGADLPWGLGVYAGGPNGVRDFEAWLGRDVAVVTSYLDKATWRSMEDTVDVAIRQWRGRAVNITLGVPLLPDRGASLAEVAAGEHDERFRRIATRIVAAGGSRAVLRLGWEFDGDWYSWSGWEDPASFVAAWRRVVGIMREVPGQRFRFDWNSAADRTDPSPLYPGDDVVDVIGLDVYDQSYEQVFADPEARWRDIVERPGGLGWLARFAEAHGKPISLPEWGLTTRHVNGGQPDNPRFVRGIHEFVATHDVLYQSYFDTAKDGETWSLRSEEFPESALVYRSLFGVA